MRTRVLRRPIVFPRVRYSVCVRCSIPHCTSFSNLLLGLTNIKNAKLFSLLVKELILKTFNIDA